MSDPLAQLIEASRDGDLERARSLLDQNVDPNGFITRSRSPLLMSAFEGRWEVVELLLSRGAKVNQANGLMESPLFLAASADHVRVIEVLIRGGADLEQRDRRGMTPLNEAASQGKFEAVKVLIESGAEVNTKNNKGATPLLVAGLFGNLEVISYLLESKADVRAMNNQGETIHLMAASTGNVDMLCLLYKDQPAYSLSLTVLFGETRLLETDAEFSKRDRVEKAAERDEVLQKTLDDLDSGICLEKKLGRGQFGEVWKGTYENRIVAVKFLQDSTETSNLELMEELSLLGSISHGNIVAFIKFIPEVPLLLMELAERGDVNQFLLSRDSQISWQLRMKWTIQLTKALIFLHQQGIIHRDLRCSNILLDKSGDAKISDFGVSVWFDENGFTKKKPHYIGKNVYGAGDGHDLEFSFDMRFLAVVMCKFLMFGKSIEDIDVLYDWRTNQINRSNLVCDSESFLDLIQLCYSGAINSAFASAFARSICAHDYSSLPEWIANQTDDGNIHNQDLNVNFLFYYKIRSLSAVKFIVELIKENDTGIAILATIPPAELKSMAGLFQYAVEPPLDLDALLSTDPKSILKTKVFARANKEDPRVLAAVLPFLDANKYDYSTRWEASNTLCMFPHTETNIACLIDLFEIEKEVGIRAKLAQVLGQIGPKAVKAVPLLERAMKEDSKRVLFPCLAAVAIITSESPEEFKELREEVLRLCLAVDNDLFFSSSEWEDVALALRFLKPQENPQVLSLLARLLKESHLVEPIRTVAALGEINEEIYKGLILALSRGNDLVKAEAGKALSMFATG